MPHKCMKCGREFRDGSVEILKGCPSCGGKKFIYVSSNVKNADVLEEKTVAEIAKETKQEVLEVHPEVKPVASAVDILDRVDSVRIMGKGKYELNLERLVGSQDLIIGMGSDGKYLVDLNSMSKPKNSNNK